MTDNPNIILIFADDLGRGMLSCYGQQHFETPNIDRLANEGMKFNHAYGCAFCAPSRASMLTGIHDCHQKLRYINRTDSFQLYHLPSDYREENDVSADHPDLVTRLSGWMLNACDGDYRNGTPGAHLAEYPDEE